MKILDTLIIEQQEEETEKKKSLLRLLKKPQGASRLVQTKPFWSYCDYISV
jgi:hypothetical protein